MAAALHLAGCTSEQPRHSETFKTPSNLKETLPRPPAADTALVEDERGRLGKAGKRLAAGLTLKEAEEIAVTANHNLLANLEYVNIARGQVVQAGLFTNPVFSFGNNAWPFFGPTQAPFPGAGGGTSGLPNGSFTDPRNGIYVARPTPFDLRYSQLQFGISKDFDLTGKRQARVDAAVENEWQTEAQYASAALTLKAQVRVAYATILIAQENLILAREAKEMAGRNRDIIGNQRLGGKGLLQDALAAEADDSRAAGDLEQAERDLEVAKRNLATLLGVPRGEVGPLRDPLPLEALPVLDEGKLTSDAIARNADVIAAKRGATQAEANLRLQNRSAVPDVTLSFQLTHDILDNVDPAQDYHNWGAVSLSVPIPMFDRNQAQVVQAEASLRQAHKQEAATEDATVQGVRNDAKVLKVSWDRVKKFQDEILPKARKRVSLTEETYVGGKALYLDVIAARQYFNQARADYVTELLNYESTLADLERLLAGPVGVKKP